MSAERCQWYSLLTSDPARELGAIKTKNRMFTRNNSNKNSKSLSGSGRRSALPKSMATVGTLGVMLAIPTLLNFKAPLNSYRPKSSTPNISSLQNKEEQYMYMYNQRRALINELSMIDMGFAEKEALPSRSMQHYFGNEIQILKSWRDVSSWNETERGVYLREFANPTQHGHGDLFYGGLCDTILVFRATNGVRRHVLISHLNENWGAFSTHVPNRTVDWGNWDGHFKAAGCTTDDLWWYLNHTNVSAVFTVTHQWLDHPKALSLPLGVTTSATARLSQELTLQGTTTINNRTEFYSLPYLIFYIDH